METTTRITDKRGFCVRALDGAVCGPHACILRGAMIPLSWVYATATALRRRALKTGLLPRRKLQVPVISVGNITTGGTGKTPFVEWLARSLKQAGHAPVILSRGYRSRPTGTSGQRRNDEALLLQQNLPDIEHLADPNRFRSGSKAIANGADCIILDDGFQHIRLARDLDLVLISAVRPFGGRRTLPAGLLREPLTALRNAHALIITHADAVPAIRREQLARELSVLSGGRPVIEASHRPLALQTPQQSEEPLDHLSGRKVFLFCGIGSPEAFRKTVLRLGADVTAAWFYNDHHHYLPRDLNDLAHACETSGAQLALTTQKDLVKIRGQWRSETPLRALRIQFDIANGRETLNQLIKVALT